MKPGNEARTESCIQGLDELFRDSWRDEEHLRRYRTRYVFRGLPDSAYQLTTAIHRLGSKKIHDAERFSLRNFKKYAHRDVGDRDSEWHWLSIAQHHGMPTRLLDWTNSPLAALHFATCELEHFDKDGVVWAVDLEKAKRLLPKKLQRRLGGAIAFTIGEVNNAFERMRITKVEHLETKFVEDFMLFFEPPALDPRITNQYAVFSIMPHLATTPEAWLRAHSDTFKRITVKAEDKGTIRDRLDMMNATERVFFPGLDGLSMWLKRYYGPSTHEVGLTKRVLHRGKHLSFHRAQGGWEYVSRVGAKEGVTIVAISANGKIVLVEQFRVPLGKRVIELPAGLVGDQGTPETPEEAAKRELLEETGFASESAEVVSSGSMSPGLSDEINHLVKIAVAKRCGPNEEGITVHEVALEKAQQWLNDQAARGKVIDLKVYSGLFFAR